MCKPVALFNLNWGLDPNTAIVLSLHSYQLSEYQMSQSALISHLPNLLVNKTRMETVPLKTLFETDSARCQSFMVETATVLFDYSKNRVDCQALSALLDLARKGGVEAAREKMFGGGKINFTENRAVLHTALRANNQRELIVDGVDVRQQIVESRKQLFGFANDVRNGRYQLTGGVVTDVVNIGIGGSDLGPVMCAAALSPYHNGPGTHFVSNVDGADFHDTVKNLNPATTLFIIASKSFTTAETMANAQLAKDWLAKIVSPEDVSSHFVALSTNLKATIAFGIAKSRTFGFWDWVGGRYSIWSAIGLSLMVAIGPDNFQNFLDGANAADEHFLSEEFENNIPVLMAMIGIWHRNVWDYSTHAILPYDNRLSRFPAYLQQLDMESNGKHICHDGSRSQVSTGPVIWGEPGTNGQHAFYQLLHQGSDIVPCDFLVAAKSHEKEQTQQQILVANCLAQSEAMMVGRSIEEVMQSLEGRGYSDKIIANLAPHKVFEGNRPSNTFLYKKLTPFILGQLIAFYEHKVFVQGIIWGINSFDQWGVELGKHLAVEIEPFIMGKFPTVDSKQLCPSTTHLVNKFLHMSK